MHVPPEAREKMGDVVIVLCSSHIFTSAKILEACIYLFKIECFRGRD